MEETITSNVKVKVFKKNPNPEVQLKLDEIKKMYSEDYSISKHNKLYGELIEIVKKYK